MTEREPVTLHLPSWLLDDVHDVLEERAGRLEGGELEAALQEHVERFLDRATSSPHGPEATDLADALRAVRRVGWSKKKAAAATGVLQAGVERELIDALSTTVCAACDTPVGKLERDWDCPACRRARETLSKVRVEQEKKPSLVAQ